MPGARVQRPVEVRDEAVLCKVEFDLAEELRQRQAVQLYGCDTGGLVLFGFLFA